MQTFEQKQICYDDYFEIGQHPGENWDFLGCLES